jgi:hypothetical protein
MAFVKNGFILLDKKKQPVVLGQAYPDHRGDMHVVTDGTPPRASHQSGYVYCYPEGGNSDHESRFYAHVLNFTWEVQNEK